MPKQNIRQLMLAKRRALPDIMGRSASRLVQQRFIATEVFAAAKVIALYAAVHNEVETGDALHAALDAAKVVLFPAVSPEGLVFRRVDHALELRQGTFGIPEPDAACTVCSPEGADLIVIPGIAFDLYGRRIGYGKGYYDKALHRLEGKGKLIAFCYDFQVVDEIVGEPHDVRMDMLITETRVIHPRGLII
jgi:5-formyltetrahydrofolate cyclo-ligase